MRNRFASQKKRSRSPLWDLVLPVVFFAAVIALFYRGLSGITRTTREEQLASARNAVTKATVQCYALEGQYPPSVDYLVEHYGLSVDREKYIIHYEVFASNIMPQIAVLPVEG